MVMLTGGDLGGEDRGRSPQNIEVGDAHASVPPHILRTSVIGCEAKYELTKKGLKEEFWVVK